MARREIQSTPVDDLPPEEWTNGGAWAQEEPQSDGDNICRFRLDANLLQLASELREDPSSPFFGMFKTKSALYRHVMTRGLIAMGESYRATRGAARSLRLQQEVLASALAASSERRRLNETVEKTIRAVSEAITDHRTPSAAGILDKFFEGITPWEEEVRGLYARTLLAHPGFVRCKDDVLLNECSVYLREFKQQYEE